MSVALQPLPGSRDKSYQDFHLIPFSDYSRWERRPAKKPPEVSKLRSRASKQQLVAAVQWTHSGKPKLPLEQHPGAHKGEKTKCVSCNALTSRTDKEPPEIKLIKIKVTSKRASLAVYKKYVKALLEDNISIISSIMELEERTHCSTDKILERYKHFKGAMCTLKLKSEEMIAEAKEELEATRRRLQDEVEAHRAEVAEVDEDIEHSAKELQLLKHYKDKEYPVRQIRIEQLKETQEEAQAGQIEELEQIEMCVSEEGENYQQLLQAKKTELEQKATGAIMDSVRRTVQMQAVQNKIMKKEIMIHRNNQHELREAISELKNALASMSMEAKQTSLPSVLTNKCLPDMEIVLDIPMQDRLLPV